MPSLQFSGKFCCALSLSLIYSWAEECSWWPFAKMPQWREPIYLHRDERSSKIMEKAELHYKGKCYLCMRIVIWQFQPKNVSYGCCFCVCVWSDICSLAVCQKAFFGCVMGMSEYKLLFVFVCFYTMWVLEHIYTTHVKTKWLDGHISSHPQCHI